MALALFVGGALSARRQVGLEAEARRIYEELRCPVCEGQSVAESNSAEAERMRAEVRAQLEAGKSRQEVLDWYAQRYGNWILNRPPLRGAYWLAWIAPAAVLAGAGWLLARRHLRRGGDGPDAHVRAADPEHGRSDAGGSVQATPPDPLGDLDVNSRLRDYL